MATKINYLTNTCLTISICLIFVLIFGCSGAIEVQSTAQKPGLKIDGFDADWKTVPTYLKDEQVSFRISNDDKFLYLCLIAHDREKALQIFSLGLTVWFDRTGKNNEVFGIRYPIGLEGKGYPDRGFRPDQNIDRDRNEQLFNELK
jgi:hypothetical protein